MVPLEPMDAVTCDAFVCHCLASMYPLVGCDGNSFDFYSSVTNVIVLDLYCLVDLVVKECFVLYLQRSVFI